jgi:hypothetical protein
MARRRRYYRCSKRGHRHRHWYYLPIYVCPAARKCDICGEEFNNSQNLRRHIPGHFRHLGLSNDAIVIQEQKGGKPRWVRDGYGGFHDSPCLSEWEELQAARLFALGLAIC